MNADHRELFKLLLPALALGLGAGWTLRGWWDARARWERTVRGVRELRR